MRANACGNNTVFLFNIYGTFIFCNHTLDMDKLIYSIEQFLYMV